MSNFQKNKEKEIKVIGEDEARIKKLILDLGGEFVRVEHQTNIHIKSSLGLVSDKEHLRIRITEFEDGSIKKEFTLKKEVENEKLRENVELNVAIDDDSNLMEILKIFNFDLFKYGYKRRETYILNGAKVEFDKWDKDTLPYSYIEIEVESEDKLEETLNILKIDRTKISLKSIRELIEELRLV